MKRVILGLLLAISTVFVFFSTDTFASSPTSTPANYIWRARSQEWFLQSQGPVNLKNYIFSGIGNQAIGRYQFSFPTNIGNLSDNTVLNVQFALKTFDYMGTTPSPNGWKYSTDARLNLSGATSSYCSVKSRTMEQIDFICEYVFETRNIDLSSIWVDVGNLSVENGNSTSGYGENYLYYGSTFWVEYINYYYNTGLSQGDQAIINALNNASVANQTIINQNNTLIDQNSQIIGGQNATYDMISNPNVSGNFESQPIPAFGPISGILNNLLELPRILLAVPACTPIRPTLPFVHQDIEIPCMSTVYAQAYPAFITFLDAIASAYIWFRVARYIVRQVQHLRDPEQEDEEYLDI